jgi:hypothetical protein
MHACVWQRKNNVSVSSTWQANNGREAARGHRASRRAAAAPPPPRRAARRPRWPGSTGCAGRLRAASSISGATCDGDAACRQQQQQQQQQQHGVCCGRVSVAPA